MDKQMDQLNQKFSVFMLRQDSTKRRKKTSEMTGIMRRLFRIDFRPRSVTNNPFSQLHPRNPQIPPQIRPQLRQQIPAAHNNPLPWEHDPAAPKRRPAGATTSNRPVVHNKLASHRPQSRHINMSAAPTHRKQISMNQPTANRLPSTTFNGTHESHLFGFPQLQQLQNTAQPQQQQPVNIRPVSQIPMFGQSTIRRLPPSTVPDQGKQKETQIPDKQPQNVPPASKISAAPHQHNTKQPPVTTINPLDRQQPPQSHIPLFGAGNSAARFNPLAQVLNQNARLGEYRTSDATVTLAEAEVVPETPPDSPQHIAPDNQNTTGNPDAQKRPISALSRFDDDDDDVSLQPSAPKSSRLEGSDNMHYIFFNDIWDIRQKLKSMFTIMKFQFNTGPHTIPLQQLVMSQLCRKIDIDHVDYLALRLQAVGRDNVESILSHSLVIAFEIPKTEFDDTQLFGIVEGNCRLASIQRYNQVNSDDPIRTMTVHFVISKQPSRSQAVIISSLASSYGERDRLQYSRAEIIRNSRGLLKYQPNIIDAQPIEDRNMDPKKWQKKYELKVKDQLCTILQIPPTKLLSPVWRTVFISDEHIEDMIVSLVLHGSSIKKLERICNGYRRRPEAVFQLCTAREIAADDTKTFFERLRSIHGANFSFSLKEKKAFDYDKTDQENMAQIMAELIHDIPEEQHSVYMEKFLKLESIKEVSRHRNYPTVADKQNYLATKFEQWFSTNPDVTAASTDEDEEPVKNGYDSMETSESEDETDLSAVEDDVAPIVDAAATTTTAAGPGAETGAAAGAGEATTAAGEQGGVKKSGIKHPKKGPQGQFTRSSRTLKLKNTKVSTIQQSHLRPLIRYPHIQALISYTLKSLSTNFDNLTAGNPLARALEGYETNEGRFNWDAFEQRQNQDNQDDS